MKNHPDRAKGDRAAATDKMAEINRAYDVLKDEEKRMHYDRFGEVFDRL
jgi:DnaJ-class molecular chaperone